MNAHKVLEPFRLLVGEVVVDVDLPVDDGGEGHKSCEEATDNQEDPRCKLGVMINTFNALRQV